MIDNLFEELNKKFDKELSEKLDEECDITMEIYDNIIEFLNEKYPNITTDQAILAFSFLTVSAAITGGKSYHMLKRVIRNLYEYCNDDEDNE